MTPEQEMIEAIRTDVLIYIMAHEVFPVPKEIRRAA